jgi:hypothetical protein
MVVGHQPTLGLLAQRLLGMQTPCPIKKGAVWWLRRRVRDGEAHLREMQEAIARTGDGLLSARIERFAATARDLFRAVEQDPGDLAAARRYMGVYLAGARDATLRFAELWAATRDAKARHDYEALLGDLESNFTARTRSLIEGGREGLEIEIDVLRERLAREGVAGPRPE